MRRWDYSITEISAYSSGISVTGGKLFICPCLLRYSQHLRWKKRKQAHYCYCLFLGSHWKNAFSDIQRWGEEFQVLSQEAVIFRLRRDHCIKCFRFKQEEWKDLPERKRKMCFSNPGHALMMRLRAAGWTLTLTLVQANVRALARLPPSLLPK